MQIGDIVRYKNEDTALGTVVWIMPEEERVDNVLVCGKYYMCPFRDKQSVA